LANYEIFMQEMGYKKPDDWRADAKCVGHPSELFELSEADSPQAVGMTLSELAEHNRLNFIQAGEICIECPVFWQCKEDATDEDRRWTVRAGEPPTGIQYQCSRGHILDEPGRCVECKRQVMKDYRAKMKGLKSA
jgi:hypothetical protein